MDLTNPSRPGAPGTGLPGRTAPGIPKPASDPDRAAQAPTSRAGKEVRDAARDLKESGKDVAARASDKLSSGARAASEQARQAASAAGEQVSHIARQAREQGAEVLNQQVERAAGVADDVAAAMRRAGEKLRQENDDNLAACTEAFADGAGSVARYLRHTDGRAMRGHAEELARRHPEWVLGGAYVVGLAVARFLKASRPEPQGAGSSGSYPASDDHAASGAHADISVQQGRGGFECSPEPARASSILDGGGAVGATPGRAAAPPDRIGVLVPPVPVAGEIRANPEVH